MSLQNGFFTVILMTFCCTAYGLDISNIQNPAGFAQTFHTQTYTVGADGTSLMYRGRDTGMRLPSPSTAGKKIPITDNNIAPRPAQGAAAASRGAAAAAGSAAAGGTTASTAATTPKKGGWSTMSKGAKAMGVLGTAAGAYGVYDSASGQGEHGAMNVVSGTASGAIMGASIGSMFTPVGAGIGAAVGAVVGGAISGSQLFSETDCLHDPVTGKFTCCNTVFNKGERQVEIGGYMFCADGNNKALPPGVRQCLQGGKDQEAGWWDGLWEDDEWEKECKPRWCNGVSAPKSGTSADSIVWSTDNTNICWAWDCALGYTQQGNTCVKNAATPAAQNSTPSAPQQSESETQQQPTTSQENSYDKMIEKVQQLLQTMQEDCSGAN